ncbi:hypothetical protein PoB_007340000 [Plakobranchus ocellatus]|uniref:Uncharacterized protein n=1 Tax=Plakobranchus ocellatus TaxID=259542 RepID=A0AAV4DSC5_9GAST|nr:hypothetical protein PoB_007340000 [Plakobranchus ocellatus]
MISGFEAPVRPGQRRQGIKPESTTEWSLQISGRDRKPLATSSVYMVEIFPLQYFQAVCSSEVNDSALTSAGIFLFRVRVHHRPPNRKRRSKRRRSS